MANDYLKALGLSAKSDKKDEEMQMQKPAAQVQGLTIQLAGMPETPDMGPVMEIIGGVAQVIEQLTAKIVENEQAIAAKQAEQTQLMQNVITAVESLGKIMMAPVVPEFDSKGKITGARRKLDNVQ